MNVSDLSQEPYSHVITYPKYNISDIENRIKELNQLKINTIIFEGNVHFGSTHVLGKGCESVVVKAKFNDQIFALKIRRTDSSRFNLNNEVEYLRLANSVDVGPKLKNYTDNMILMELITDITLSTWIENLSSNDSALHLKNNIRDLLVQCRKLDNIGLDHGELSNLFKHVFVGEKTSILDFESSSISRRVKNVSSAIQWLFIGGPFSPKIRDYLNISNVDDVKNYTKLYKSKMNDSSFDNLLKCIKII